MTRIETAVAMFRPRVSEAMPSALFLRPGGKRVGPPALRDGHTRSRSALSAFASGNEEDGSTHEERRAHRYQPHAVEAGGGQTGGVVRGGDGRDVHFGV